MHTLAKITAAAAVATFLAAPGGAQAAFFFQTDVFAPLPPPGTITPVVVQGRTAGPVDFSGTGYSVRFDGTAAPQGVAVGALTNTYAIPVAGETLGGAPLFLSGDFGSPTTGAESAAGRYLSTGNSGSIEITFTDPQRGFALLWGSVDGGNRLRFFDGATLLATLTGANIQSTPGFTSNGDQGPGGSVYVRVGGIAFDRVVADSSVISFEFAGAVGAEQGFGVPVPMSVALFGVGLLGLGFVARRRAA